MPLAINKKTKIFAIIAILIALYFISKHSVQISTFSNYTKFETKTPSNMVIYEWKATIDDHLIQVFNAILIALKFNHNLMIPKHDFMKKQYYKINPAVSEDTKFNQLPDVKVKTHKNFLNIRDTMGMSKKTAEAFDDEKNIIKAIKLMKENWKEIIPPKNNNKFAVIHLRGSPRVWGTSDKGLEAPAPLSYFTDILDSNNFLDKFEKIYLISEDRKNTCIEPILKKYGKKIIDKIHFSKKDQINLILQAKTVVASHGNCMQGILLLSENIEELHRPLFKRGHLTLTDKFRYHTHDISLYNELLRGWKNDEKDNNLVLTWKK